MTRFFTEDSESGTGSFAQLLNGAVQPSLMTAPEQIDPWERVVFGGERGGGGAAKDGFFRENRPLGLMVSRSSFFTVPAGISPASLLGSPAPNFSSSSAENPYSLLQRLPPPPPSNTNHAAFESTDDETQADQRSIPTSLLVDKPADDGYNWRKYGQKQVKGSEYPRSYYKCTHPSCIVKKKVERALDGHVTEIIYKGQHNHQPPAPNRRGNEIDHPANSETDLQSATNLHLLPKRERESVHRTSEKFPGSNNGEDGGLVWRGVDDGDDNEPDPSRRRVETGIRDSTQSQAVTEPRIIVQTTSEVDLLDDGYRWRKYGQKVVKGNPHPRSYYKCTNTGCNVRKHVERASTDSKAVMTTYEGKHNHVVPVARNSSHQMANGGSVDSMQPNIRVTIANDQLFLKRLEYKNNIQQQAPIHMKKEYDIA